LAVNLPDIRSGRTLDGNPTRLHGLRQLADQFDPEQAVVKRRSLDLDVVRQIELPLERPRRNPLVQEFALLFFGFLAFHGKHALFCSDGYFIGRKTRDRQRDLVAVFAQALDIAGRIIVLCPGLLRGLREIEKAEKKAREAERSQQADRNAAMEAERTKAESAEKERALQAEQKAARDARYAARKSRPKRRSVRPLVQKATRP